MQHILISLGDPIVASDIQEIATSLSRPGILEGFELVAEAGNLLGLNPGIALMDSGEFLVETELITEAFTTGVSPANYTVFYNHVNDNATFGGTPATLTVQSGFIPVSSFEHGVLIGWIQYPGGVPLTDSSVSFISAPRFKLDRTLAKTIGEFSMAYAPLSSRLSLQGSTGPTLVLSDAYSAPALAPLTSISNPGIVLGTSVYLFPFTVSSLGLGQIKVVASADALSALTVTVMSSNGTVITPVSGNFFSNVPITKSIIPIQQTGVAKTALVPNSEAFIQLTVVEQPGGFCKIQALGTSSYTDPF